MTEPPVRLGLRPNAAQFSLLVLVNAFVGAMVGLERSTLPLIGVQRDDVIRPGLTTDEALANAPKGGRDGEFFRVQEILEGR